MFDLKFIISVCFLNGKQIYDKKLEAERALNFGEAVAQIDKTMPYGVYTNTIVLQLVDRMGLPIESMVHFILPGPNNRFPTVQDLLSKYSVKYNMLNPLSRNEYKSSFERILPLIKSDGTLFMIEKMLDRDYAGQIDLFIQDLLQETEGLKHKISRVLIDGIQFKSQWLIQVL